VHPCAFAPITDDALRRLFLSDTDESALGVVPIADYRSVIATRVSPNSVGQPREDALMSVDFLSSDIAVTKVRLRIQDKIFAKHLNWAYVNASFVIVAKLWHDITLAFV
jgi:hypothetical protein